MAERFEDLPLDSRVEVVYEREVHAEKLHNAAAALEDLTDLGRHPTDVIAALPGWYAIVDAEGDLVCLVPPGGIDRDANADDVVGARASVVAAMLNQKAPREAAGVDLHRDMRIITESALQRGEKPVPPTLVIRHDNYRRVNLTGRSLRSAELVCTFADLENDDIRRWLASDVATRLMSGGKLTLRLV